ncbi:MAG: DUF3500 domain-containing protein [Alphaproteobacteria bacterium]|nr:DUF3500 domain-containing protein [Alphaproteobacteria bacterium]
MPDRRSFLVAAPITFAGLLSIVSTKASAQSSDGILTPNALPDAGATRAAVAAATNFLDSLSPEQQDRVLYDVLDSAIREWIYFPQQGDRNGISFGELSDQQLSNAFGVAEAVLSVSGYTQFRGIIAAEDELGVRNNNSAVNSGRYFIAFFGRPSATSRFTVQITGHHFAINTTYENGQISPTPTFTGADPVEIEMDGRRVRPMLAKTNAYSGLLNSFNDEELAAGRMGRMGDVRVGNGDSNRYPEPEGVFVTDLKPEQQERVYTLVRAWVGDADERIVEPLMSQYQADFDRTRVAWSGSTDPDVKGAYLRVDGPRLWIEFSNVGRFGNGDEHYHTIFRDKQADYLA